MYGVAIRDDSGSEGVQPPVRGVPTTVYPFRGHLCLRCSHGRGYRHGEFYGRLGKTRHAFRLRLPSLRAHDRQEQMPEPSATNILFKFYELQDYKETSDYISECEKNIAYINAINEIRHSSNVVALEKTKKLFLGFAGFKESNKYIEKIDEKILMLKKRKKRIKTIIIIALIAVFVLIAVKLTSSFLYYRSDDYKLLKAKEFMANEQYSQAMEYLNDMEDKKVANQQIKKIQCKEAKSYFEKEEYDKAIAIYHKWGEKEEERKVIQQKALMLLYENKFTEAIKLYEQIKDEDNLIFAYGRLARYYRDSGEYDKAIEIYNKIDSEEGKESVYEFQAYNLIDQKRYDEVEKLYKYIKDENILKDIQEEVCRQKTEN